LGRRSTRLPLALRRRLPLELGDLRVAEGGKRVKVNARDALPRCAAAQAAEEGVSYSGVQGEPRLRVLVEEAAEDRKCIRIRSERRRVGRKGNG